MTITTTRVVPFFGVHARPGPDPRDDLTPFTSRKEIDDYIQKAWDAIAREDEYDFSLGYCPRMRMAFKFLDSELGKPIDRIMLRSGTFTRPGPDPRDDFTPFASMDEIDAYLYDFWCSPGRKQFIPRLGMVFKYMEEHGNEIRIVREES